MGKLYYSEEQRWRQWWLWGLLIVITLMGTLLFGYGIYFQEVLHKPWGSNPGSTGLLIFAFILDSLIMTALLVLLYKMRLIVEINSDGIRYRYPPLISKWKIIKKEEIERFELRNYKPVFEYGGWGIKGGSKKSSYTVSGKSGLQLHLKNGRKVLFGTQKKQAIKYAMDKLMDGGNIT